MTYSHKVVHTPILASDDLLSKDPATLTTYEPGEPSQSPSPAISLRDVSRHFTSDKRESGLFTALSDVDLEVDAGTIVCLIGPSGCGKSTVLNMAAGLLPPSSGEVLYRNEPIKSINTSAGYITQKDNLLPWRLVERNVGLALELQGVPRAERSERVNEALETVGLGEFRRYYPAQLSGGMRKRATLARTFIYEPETMLMDEPFGALDAQMKVHLQSALLKLWERKRQTVLFVTHDLEEAIAVGDRVVVFGTKPGRIVHEEAIDIPRPRNIVELRSTPDFMSTVARLWRHLAVEVEKTMPSVDSTT